jgi:hypothetical protein
MEENAPLEVAWSASRSTFRRYLSFMERVAHSFGIVAGRSERSRNVGLFQRGSQHGE